LAGAIGGYDKIITSYKKETDIYCSYHLHWGSGQLEFRKKSGISAKDRASVEATVLGHVERYFLIEG